MNGGISTRTYKAPVGPFSFRGILRSFEGVRRVERADDGSTVAFLTTPPSAAFDRAMRDHGKRMSVCRREPDYPGDPDRWMVTLR